MAHARLHDHSDALDGTPIAVAGVPNLPASKITSEQFTLPRMPRGIDGHVLTGTGVGSNPAYEEVEVGVVADYQVFTTSGTWTKPAGITFALVECIGGGGNGGTGGGGSYRTGGGGGGGGAVIYKFLRASELGATEAVTVGAAGGDSYFGATKIVWAGGGENGLNGGNSTNQGRAGGSARFLSPIIREDGIGGRGAGRTYAWYDDVTHAEWGGASGGASTNANTSTPGGDASLGGGGGGGGGDNSVRRGGAGGDSGNATGGTRGADPGGDGGDGTDALPGTCGGGGGGGGGSTTVGGDGGDGGVPGGGAGGGGGGTISGGTGGAGGRGEVRILSW